MGYGDVQCQNPDSKIPTPNIDKLAAQGMRFADTHTNSSVCSPTRYGIITGRYSWRTWLQRGALHGYQKAMIENGRMTVASMLSDNGYYTSCIGKWHMGWNWQPKDGADTRKGLNGSNVDFAKPFIGGPVDCGFDSFFGLCASLDIPPYCYSQDNKVIKLPTLQVERGVFGMRPGLAAPDLKPAQVMLDINDKIKTLIKDHKVIAGGKPFFVYYSLPAPHYPVVPAEQFKGKTSSLYGDYVHEVDWIVGEVMQSLEEAGIADDTIVIFTSDNGASPTASASAVKKGHKPNWPFRGGKASIWEGGHRVPFIVRWPASVKPGAVNDEVFCTTDLMATCADILGMKIPDNAGEDSVSMLPALMGKSSEPPRKGIIHHSINGNFGFRSGKWKYIMTNGSGGWNSTLGMPGFKINKSVKGQLYDMSSDTLEKKNLFRKNPEIAQLMKKQMQDIVENGRSTPGINQKNDVPVSVK